MSAEFHITGKHVLSILIGFFLFVFTANAIFLTHAVRSFPGEREEKTYLQGLNYNDRLSARATQQKRGWKASIEKADWREDNLHLEVTMKNELGAPMSGLQLHGALSRPANAKNDFLFQFSARGAGRYEAVLSVEAGVWDLIGVATNADNETFEFTNRLVLQ